MPAIAYRTPLSEEMREEFEGLNLHGMSQETIACAECKTEYVLIYPDGSSAETMRAYRLGVESGMQDCARHSPQIRLSF